MTTENQERSQLPQTGFTKGTKTATIVDFLPKESNTILVLICRQEGTYDPKQYNSYLAEYQFSAKSDDPNEWVLEGIRGAIATLANRGHQYHEPVVADCADHGGLDKIPF